VDIKKVSNGTSMDKQYARAEKSCEHFSKTITKFGETLKKSAEIPQNTLKTSLNFFNPKENLPNLSCNSKQVTPRSAAQENNDNKQRTVFSSQGRFNIKHENIEYERKLHTSHANRHEDMGKMQKIKENMRKSDPFFLDKFDSSNERFIRERERNLLSTKPNYHESDVFFSKEFDKTKDKSIDKHLIAENKVKIYGCANLSKSEWSPKNSKINLLNHTSVPFSIFNASVKSFVKTKDEISRDHNGSPANRQKALNEYIDLARVFHPNPNKEYLNALNNSSTAFHKNSNICANYQDLHRMYGSLCDKPFVKKII